MRNGIYDSTQPATFVSITIPAGVTFGQGFIGPATQGYYWELERLSCQSGSGTTPTLEVAVLSNQSVPLNNAGTAVQWDRQGRVDLSAAAKNYQGDYNNSIYVPEGYHLVFLITGANAADVFNISCQLSIYLKSFKIEASLLQHQQLEHMIPGPDVNHVDYVRHDAMMGPLDMARDALSGRGNEAGDSPEEEDPKTLRHMAHVNEQLDAKAVRDLDDFRRV